jgi:hypothetical protein
MFAGCFTKRDTPAVDFAGSHFLTALVAQGGKGFRSFLERTPFEDSSMKGRATFDRYDHRIMLRENEKKKGRVTISSDPPPRKCMSDVGWPTRSSDLGSRNS